MSKLFHRKKWLTVADTACQLSQMFDEPVSHADVLQLALEGRIQLSVWFPSPVYAKHVQLYPRSTRLAEMRKRNGLSDESAPAKGLHKFTWPPMTKEDADGIRARITASLEHINTHLERRRDFNIVENFLTKGDKLIISDDVRDLRGVYDLPMFCGERLDVEAELAALIGGDFATAMCIDGCLVRDLVDGDLLQIQVREVNHDRISYQPAETLPDDTYFVVRTDALLSFEQSSNGEPIPSEKPIAASERNSLLTIIAALCDYSGINLKNRGTACQIAKLTEEFGAPVSDDTMRRTLAKIPEALGVRMK